MTIRELVSKIKQHPIIAILLLVSAIIGAFLTIDKGATRLWQILYPPINLSFSGDVCTISDKGCKEGNLDFQKFLSGTGYENVTLNLVINTVTVGEYAERCQDSQDLYDGLFSADHRIFHFPTTTSCLDGTIFLIAESDLNPLDAGAGFITEKINGEFLLTVEDGSYGPFAAQKFVKQ